MSNPVKVLSAREKILWLVSVIAVVVSNFFTKDFDPLTMVAAVTGVTSLIFAAKGHVIAQVLMIIFSILYAMISFRFRYWGEMITYLGMCLPMAVWSLVTWYKNPSEQNRSEVAIRHLKAGHIALLGVSSITVTAVFCFLLVKLNTPNITLSTVSILTSFVAAALTAMRSSYFALAYASNDLVLIIMWVLASMQDLSYIPVVVNFAVFFINDMYGFISWKKRETKQQAVPDSLSEKERIKQ